MDVRPTLLSKANIAKLWMELAGIYTHLFINKYGIEDSGSWFETLKDLTPYALENGIEKLRSLSAGEKFAEYPPNCLQFRMICLSVYDGLSLPSVGEAYRETRSRSSGRDTGQWSHDAVKYTAKRLGDSFLAIEHDHEAYPRYKKCYEQVCHLVRQGHSVPVIHEPVMIQKPPSAAETARHHLQLLKKHLRG